MPCMHTCNAILIGGLLTNRDFSFNSFVVMWTYNNNSIVYRIIPVVKLQEASIGCEVISPSLCGSVPFVAFFGASL